MKAIPPHSPEEVEILLGVNPYLKRRIYLLKEGYYLKKKSHLVHNILQRGRNVLVRFTQQEVQGVKPALIGMIVGKPSLSLQINSIRGGLLSPSLYEVGAKMRRAFRFIMSVSFDTGSYADVLLEARNPLQIPVLVKVTILFLRYKREKFPSSEILPSLSYTFSAPYSVYTFEGALDSAEEDVRGRLSLLTGKKESKLYGHS